VARAEAYLHGKFHLDPSNRLTTITPTLQAGQTDRQSDSIGRTVLQTVAQLTHAKVQNTTHFHSRLYYTCNQLGVTLKTGQLAFRPGLRRTRDRGARKREVGTFRQNGTGDNPTTDPSKLRHLNSKRGVPVSDITRM